MLSSSINLQWPPFIQRAASDILTDYGPFVFGNRPVRTRMPGGVGAGGGKPPGYPITPSTGVNLWGESPLPLYMNPVNVSTLTQVLAKGKGGTARNRPKEAGAQSCEPTNRNSIQGPVSGLVSTT